MMLTVFLIGLAAGLVALNVERDSDDIAKLEARRFAALVTHLQDESTFAGLPMGIEVREQENLYRFWRLEDRWLPVERLEVLRDRHVPEEVTLLFNGLQRRDDSEAGAGADDAEDDDEDADSETAPRIPRNLLVVEPTGMIRPFITTFRGGESAFHVSLDNEFNPVISREEI